MPMDLLNSLGSVQLVDDSSRIQGSAYYWYFYCILLDQHPHSNIQL